MTDQMLLWLILFATVAGTALAAPIALILHEEITSAKAIEKAKGLAPLGVAVYLVSGAAYAAWFLYAWRTDEWLLFAIPVAAGLGRITFRAITKTAQAQGDTDE